MKRVTIWTFPHLDHAVQTLDLPAPIGSSVPTPGTILPCGPRPAFEVPCWIKAGRFCGRPSPSSCPSVLWRHPCEDEYGRVFPTREGTSARKAGSSGCRRVGRREGRRLSRRRVEVGSMQLLKHWRIRQLRGGICHLVSFLAFGLRDELECEVRCSLTVRAGTTPKRYFFSFNIRTHRCFSQ